METQTKAETKKERRARQLTEHYAKCEALARKLGNEKSNGKKISNALRQLEGYAHAGATAYCNGEAYMTIGRTFDFGKDGSEAWEPFTDTVDKRLIAILGAMPPGFFVNGDARGYALKIDNDNAQGKALIDELRLHTDWGGYGILSPDLQG